MAGRGAVRGAVGAWLGLIALQALVSKGGASATSGVLGFAGSVVKRALSPDVAAIPDRRSASGTDAANLGATTDTHAPLPNFNTIPVPAGTGSTGGGGTTKHI